MTRSFIFTCFILIPRLIVAVLYEPQSCAPNTENNISWAMIADETIPRRSYSLAQNFTKTLAQSGAHFKYWPTQSQKTCGGSTTVTQVPSEASSPISNQAHRAVWESFYNKNGGCRDILVVFQYDGAVRGRDNAVSLLMQSVQTQSEDIMFFGYCFKSEKIPKFLKGRRFRKYHPKATGLAPHCLHAYAITREGAHKLLNEVDICGASADGQIAELANRKSISYNYTSTNGFPQQYVYDPDFTKSEFAKYGVHWRDDDFGSTGNRDGLFAQVVLDGSPSLPFLPGTAAHDLGRERSVFILDAHNEWRYIPTGELYEKLLGSNRKGPVKVLTTWQFSHLKEGAELTDEDTSAMLKLREALPDIRV